MINTNHPVPAKTFGLTRDEWTALSEITLASHLEFIASFQPDEPFCPSPAAKTAPVASLAAPMDAGQVRGTPSKLMTCEEFRELCALRAEAA